MAKRNTKKIQKPSIPGDKIEIPKARILTIVSENDLGDRKDKQKFEQEFKKHFRFRTWANWLDSTSTKEFTNYCKSSEEFSNNVYYVIQKMIPWIYEYASDLFVYRNQQSTPLKHSHVVDEKHIQVVQEIAYEVTNERYDDPELNWWEIGGPQSIRMFGIYFDSEPGFYPVFMDWHHLVYPDIKYNSSDYKNYRYLPQKSNH